MYIILIKIRFLLKIIFHWQSNIKKKKIFIHYQNKIYFTIIHS